MHVAIIMNGTGRWATRRGLAPTAGYAAGIAALRDTVAGAAAAGVDTLTLYPHEMRADIRVLEGYLHQDAQRFLERSVRVSVIGNRELPCRHATDPCLHLRIVVDYSAHDRIVQSAWRSTDPEAWERFNQQMNDIDPTALPAGPVDLLVRTGSGRCQSQFMLWEVAYAKLHYVDRLWPDFTALDLQSALAGRAGPGEPAMRIA